MKNKSITSKYIILGIIALGIFICLITTHKYATKKQIYNTTYYTITIPYNWNLKSLNGDYLNKLSLNQENIISIEVFQDCKYNNSITSIITNIYGVHSYIKDEVYTKKINNYTLTKVNIGFEQSASEEYKKSPAEPIQLHYFYVKNNILIDFFVISNSVEEHIIDEIAESLILN
ncbi:MAG: hypothetical protein KIC94_07545 [Clostridiales bacterium]|nr:hypothetical protein [Clostridiales bacterium]